jgi:hypothetical protein
MKVEDDDTRNSEPDTERWRSLLRQHDPAERSIDPRRAIEIRHAAIELARESKAPASPWPWRLAVGAVAMVLLAAGAGDDGRPVSDAPPVVASPGAERRQVQFATPGGTRIIWEINPEFTLREMVP